MAMRRITSAYTDFSDWLHLNGCGQGLLGASDLDGVDDRSRE